MTRLASGLLGAHVAERAEEVAGHGHAGVGLEAGEAEVGDPELGVEFRSSGFGVQALQIPRAGVDVHSAFRHSAFRTSIMRFEGLMSRWTMPIWWAWSRASAAWMPSSATRRKKSVGRVGAEGGEGGEATVSEVRRTMVGSGPSRNFGMCGRIGGSAMLPGHLLRLRHSATPHFSRRR